MQDIFERMQRIISEQFSVEEDEITMDTSFEDIGEVQEDELSGLSTVGDCVNFLTSKLDD